ncbi:MAG: hypothetical protein FJ146_17980 [Deltaproteobacteria bacterium]|nr:hypothetical protein [Deltaproteobacteria bacterium]
MRDPLKEAITSEIDYNLLIYLLRHYKFPRNKISSLIASGSLVRVKKGLYVRGDAPYSLPVLANMVYGPSYVSQHYALGMYGLIPERVHAVTCMTLGRRKQFDTPVGVFSYEPLPARLYSVGIRRVELSPTQPYQIATPEKAIVDIIWRRKDLNSTEAMDDYLTHDLRLDLDRRHVYSLSRMRKIESVYHKRCVKVLTTLLAKRLGS